MIGPFYLRIRRSGVYHISDLPMIRIYLWDSLICLFYGIN